MSRKKVGSILGAGLFVLMLAIPAPAGMSIEAWRVAAVTILMAVFWITEALPIPATSLLPIVFFPIFGVMSSPATTAAYGANVIFLFMGGFFLAATMEKWHLHRRVALNTIKLTGTTPSKIVLGFAVATFLLSMWVSNTATAVMMTPIGIAVASSLTGKTEDPNSKKLESNFNRSLMLMIAYAATIGGLTTIIATPANAIAVGMLGAQFGLSISFLEWMMIGVPMGILFTAFTWFLLTKVLYRTGDLQLMGGREVIDQEHAKLGPMTTPEKRLLIIATLMVFSWVTRGFINHPALAMVTDTQVAIAGATLLFMIPANKEDRLLDWNTALKIPWGICLLFGGGIAIANGFEATGLATWISDVLAGIDGLTLFTAVLIATLLVNIMTEVTSNTAVATLFIPIMGAFAIALGVHPFATILAVCFASSMAFALPVATPPNAIVFASGHIDIKDMVTAGLLLKVFAVPLIMFVMLVWLPMVWGIDLNIIPQAVLDFIAE